MSDDTTKALASLGKGLQSLHLKVGRLTDAVQALSAPQSSTADLTPALLDLLDAVYAAAGAAPAEVAQGLRIAAGAATDALAREGVTPIPSEGAVDPAHHQVIATLPAPVADKHGHIAIVHRQGWVRRGQPLRTAQVTAYKVSA